MEPTKELADAIDRERILRARQMTPEEKLLAGPQLFDMVCVRMEAGIRSQFPEASAEQVKQILADRLALARRLETCR